MNRHPLYHLWRKGFKMGRKLYAANVQLALDDRPPILVYQMGKVGSSSIRDSLWARDLGPVFHLHWFYPWRHKKVQELPLDEADREAVAEEIAQEKKVAGTCSRGKKVRRFMLENGYYSTIYEKVIAPRRRAKVVTMVREPASTNVSMFFQSFEDYAEARFKKSKYSTEDVIDIFEENYIFSWPLTWFDKEMKPMLGLDVYDYPFPREKGHRVIEKGPYDLLLLKCELGDAEKQDVIARFLGLSDFEIIRRNESKNKSYARHYREFKDRVSLPEEELDRLCRSKYAQHFYTPQELEQMKVKWS